MSSVQERLLQHLQAEVPAAALTSSARLVVAHSGGLDSSVLLRLMVLLRQRYGFSVGAVHVHHGLSAYADAWQQHCEQCCAELDVPLQVHRVSLDLVASAGLEAEARRVRWQVLRAQEADWLVLGHHADDQAETVLFRLARGAGVLGASAMRAVTFGRDGQPGVLRPLLNVRRRELEAFAHEAGLHWVEDDSNSDVRFTRNYLRHAVMPALQAAVPGSVAGLVRAAGHFHEAAGLLSDLAQLDVRACGGAGLVLERLLALPEARVRNVLRDGLVQRGAQAPSAVQLAEWLRQLRAVAQGGGSAYWPQGEWALVAYRGRAWWVPHFPAEVQMPWVWRGEAQWEWQGAELRAQEVVGEGLDQGWLAAQWREGGLRWGAAQAGLKMRLALGRPRRSFKNLCQEAGIPEPLRSRLPVLSWHDQAIWIGAIGGAPGEWQAGPQARGVRLAWLGADWVRCPVEMS